MINQFSYILTALLTLAYAPLNASYPTITHIDGRPVNGCFLAQHEYVISNTIESRLNASFNYVGAIMVRDRNDNTVYLSIYSTTLKPFGNQTFASSWMPESNQTYSVHTYGLNATDMQAVSNDQVAYIKVVSKGSECR